MGEAALALGDTKRAFDLINECKEILVNYRPIMAAMPLTSLSLAALSLNNLQEAEHYLQQSLALALDGRNKLQLCRALFAGTLIASLKGQQKHAVRLSHLAHESPHFANSEWYTDIAARYLKQKLAS